MRIIEQLASIVDDVTPILYQMLSGYRVASGNAQILEGQIFASSTAWFTEVSSGSLNNQSS